MDRYLESQNSPKFTQEERLFEYVESIKEIWVIINFRKWEAQNLHVLLTNSRKSVRKQRLLEFFSAYEAEKKNQQF